MCDVSHIYQCYGSGMFIPDPNFFHPGFRIRIFFNPGSASKNLSILTPEKWFLNSPEIWSGLFIPDPDPGSWIFTRLGSRIQRSKRHRFPIPDPHNTWYVPQLIFPRQPLRRRQVKRRWRWRRRRRGQERARMPLPRSRPKRRRKSKRHIWVHILAVIFDSKHAVSRAFTNLSEFCKYFPTSKTSYFPKTQDIWSC